MGNSKKKGTAFYEGGSWFHRVKILQEDGTTKYSKRGGFQTESEAEHSFKKYEDAYKKACRSNQLKKKVNTKIGLKDYLLYWFENVYSLRVENTTKMLGAYTLYTLIMPFLEESDVKLLYANTTYCNELLAQVSTACSSAGNKARELLNIAMKDAVLEGYVSQNPITATQTYPRRTPSVTVLSRDLLKRFLSVSNDNVWYLEILLALFCGLRKGEILGSKFSDIDFANSTIRIKRQITSNPIVSKGSAKIEEYQVLEKPPKTYQSYRTLKIPKAVMEELMKRKEKIERCKEDLGEQYIDNDYISCRENGLPHSTSAFNIALTKICSQNGIPHLSVHALRHMYATILLEQGVPLVKISALLGHKSVTTTFEYYCDQMDEQHHILTFMNESFEVGGQYE